MNYLSISAIFKWENPWLKEWLDYHLTVGIEHFYLYNNDDDTTESDRILKPYVERGIVDNIPMPGRALQVYCMQDAVKQFQEDTFWLAMIDLDEFILPRTTDDVREVLEDYELYSGLAVHWCVFGSNGHHRRPPNQIDHFLRRSCNEHPLNRHVKSIVRPDQVIPTTFHTPHVCQYRTGHCVNEIYRFVETPFDDYSGSRIRLNHYIVRSLQDTQEIKIPRMRPDCLLPREIDFFKIHDHNDIYDDEISRRFGCHDEHKNHPGGKT